MIALNNESVTPTLLRRYLDKLTPMLHYVVDDVLYDKCEVVSYVTDEDEPLVLYHPRGEATVIRPGTIKTGWLLTDTDEPEFEESRYRLMTKEPTPTLAIQIARDDGQEFFDFHQVVLYPETRKLRIGCQTRTLEQWYKNDDLLQYLCDVGIEDGKRTEVHCSACGRTHLSYDPYTESPRPDYWASICEFFAWCEEQCEPYPAPVRAKRGRKTAAKRVRR